VAGTGFQVTFNVLGLFECLEGGVKLQFPRGKLRSMGTSASIVIGKPLFEIGGMTAVELCGMRDTLQNVRGKHSEVRQNGLPSSFAKATARQVRSL
jgi:hypothetical protein